MEAIETLRNQADELRKAKSYETAIPLYEKLWNSNLQVRSEWDGWKYAYCLRKVGRSVEALNICRETYKIKQVFENNRDLYGWCVFDLEINKSSEEIKKDEQSFFKAAKAITELSKPGTFSATNPTIMKAVDYLSDKEFHPKYPFKEILEWLRKTTPSTLPYECRQGKSQDGKTIEYASELEKWYAHLCKALFEAEQYSECVKLGEEAIQTIQKLHNDNDIWIKYRVGLAKGKLGEYEEGIFCLKEVRQRKRDWFVSKEIAKLYYDQSDYDSALKFSAEAALAPGQDNLGFRWELFMFMGQVLKSQQQIEKAKDHLLLAAKVRQKENWKIEPTLSSLLSELEVDLTDQRSIVQIHKSLVPYWDGIVHQGQEKLAGTISKWFAEGKTGLIKGEEGKEYYFKTNSFKRNSRNVSLGAAVNFYSQPNPEKRYPEAMDLELLR